MFATHPFAFEGEEKTAAALTAAGHVLRTPCEEYAFSCPYADYEKCRALLETLGVMLGEPEFGADVRVRYTVRAAEAQFIVDKIFDSTYGRISPAKCGEGWEKIKI